MGHFGLTGAGIAGLVLFGFFDPAAACQSCASASRGCFAVSAKMPPFWQRCFFRRWSQHKAAFRCGPG